MGLVARTHIMGEDPITHRGLEYYNDSSRLLRHPAKTEDAK